MTVHPVNLVADVSSDRIDAVRPVLEGLAGAIVTETPADLHVEAWLDRADPRAPNRALLSAMRRVERRTRLRAE